MTENTLARARAGDQDAFRELTDPHRRELQVHIYQGRNTISAFLRGAQERRGAPMRLVATFGCYLSVSETEAARAFSLFVLTLEGNQISAITWFADSSVFPQFGLPRMLR